MGASNVAAVYATYAGKLPPLAIQVLAYMALVSRDEDRHPWYGQGHAALAQFALGRSAPVGKADIRAVERAVAPLLASGAISTDRRASVRHDGPHTVRYRLHLVAPRPTDSVGRERADEPSRPTETGGREPADCPARPTESGGSQAAQGQQDPTESGSHVPRNPCSRPTESVATSHEFRGTEEPGGTTRSEKTRNTEDLRTEVTVPCAREAAQDPDFPDDGRPPPTPNPRAAPATTAPAPRPASPTAQKPATAVAPYLTVAPEDPPRRPCPPGIGFCVTCRNVNGQVTLTSDPTGSYCDYHLRERAHV